MPHHRPSAEGQSPPSFGRATTVTRVALSLLRPPRPKPVPRRPIRIALPPRTLFPPVASSRGLHPFRESTAGIGRSTKSEERPVAQLDRASAFGAECRGFESCRACYAPLRALWEGRSALGTIIGLFAVMSGGPAAGFRPHTAQKPKARPSPDGLLGFVPKWGVVTTQSGTR